ncbi:TadE family type IV pilus minor pilin [Nocardia brasiliensis]|uniref:TadE family type IV pilus minor pilin n=1 Tax=Nocardia brasiliensis TaxID=37326 RepID=UPI002456AB38|nr:TadE family type IV pilus minor pilin [Nocardia brasiliensis]
MRRVAHAARPRGAAPPPPPPAPPPPPPPPPREAARLAARGDEANALTAAHRVAPPSADISLRIEGTYVIARVTARAPLLPLLTLHADAVATREPGSAQ